MRFVWGGKNNRNTVTSVVLSTIITHHFRPQFEKVTKTWDKKCLKSRNDRGSACFLNRKKDCVRRKPVCPPAKMNTEGKLRARGRGPVLLYTPVPRGAPDRSVTEHLLCLSPSEVVCRKCPVPSLRGPLLIRGNNAALCMGILQGYLTIVSYRRPKPTL